MGIIALDSEFYIEGIDERITQLFGYAQKDLCGQALTLLIPSFDKTKYNAGQQISNNKETERQARTKKNHIISLEYDVHIVLQQDKTFYIVMVNKLDTVYSEINEQNLVNQSQGHEWLAYLLRASPVVIYSCIPSGNYPTTFISENIETLTGYSPMEYLADPSFWLNHLHPDDKDDLFAEMSELFETQNSLSYEYRFLCADGNYIWVLDKLKVSYDEQGKPTEMLGLWLDITKRKNDEELLKKKTNLLTESNAEHSQFTYVVSHDLKAPLRAIHSYCEWLSEDLEGKLEPEQQEYISGMKDAVQEAESLIEDLLELSRVGRRAVEVESIKLTEFFIKLTRSVTADGAVSFEVTENMPVIDVSPTVLTQVFQNLITNAFTYNNSDKKIVKIEGHKQGRNYIISVTDNGIGIDEKYHDRIFQLFQRLHTKDEYDGSGIGLAIVHKAISHLGWTITLTSSLNKGSTFSVSFPIKEIRHE
jgi:PAS domain S-box-containing protein